MVGEDDVEETRSDDGEGEVGDDTTTMNPREGIIAGEEVANLGAEDGVAGTRVNKGMLGTAAVR